MAETMQDYVKRHMIEVRIVKDRGTQADDRGWEHHAYVLELVNQQNRTMEVPWRQGMGIGTSPTDTPAEVLDSVVRDAWGADMAFPDWADEHGYDDIHDAWETYHACVGIREQLVDFLGGFESDLDYLATEVESL